MIIGVEVGKYHNKEFGKINTSRAAATIIVMGYSRTSIPNEIENVAETVSRW